MKLGVFDSGIGGEAVARSLREAFADAEIVVVNDRAHMPYGDRTIEDVTNLTDTAIQPLLGSDIIIIACNTATAAAIETLRRRYPEQLFIGLEPMVKPATHLTKTGTITICATPATLQSQRYQALKETYAKHATVVEPDCSSWAKMIEDNAVNEALVADMVHCSKGQNSDVIVLACTHYHWIKQLISKLAGADITVLDPSEAITRRVTQLLSAQPQ